MSDYVQPIRDYSHLTLAQVQRRLSLAEDVALMYGWTGRSFDTDRDKAAHELWRSWHNEAEAQERGFTRPRRHPHLGDGAVAPLVVQRDEIRASTLARIHAASAHSRLS